MAAARAATEQSGSLVEGGIAYIRFAIEHPAHYEVMFRPELYHPDDETLIKAREAGTGVLSDAVRRSLGLDATEEDVLRRHRILVLRPRIREPLVRRQHPSRLRSRRSRPPRR